MTRWLTALALGAVTLPAQAVLCKYVDDDGHVTYSDAQVKGAKKVSCIEAPPVPPAPAPRAAPNAGTTPAPAAGAAAPARSSLPSVEPETQRRRDDSRRKILMDELAVEEKSLTEARKALADGEAVRMGDERNNQRYLDRVQGLKERVTLHERNVNALKLELSNLR